VERLEERLGRPAAPAYDLAYTITTTPVGVGITTENAITRYNLTGSVDWTLTNRATGARVAGGRVESFTSYSATGSTVAGLAAEEDAALRLMRILADQIVTRLIATAGQWA
jgi:LPS-assembly lipoprotein